MEYEEFEEQFINHVKYMAGWSKIQGKCVVETVMIAGNENKRIRFQCIDQRVVLPEIYITDMWKDVQSIQDDLKAKIRISDTAYTIRRAWEELYDTVIHRCNQKNGPGISDQIKPLFTNRKTENEMLKNLIWMQKEEIAVYFYVTNRKKKECFLSKGLADIWNIGEEILLKSVFDKKEGDISFESWIEKNDLANSIGRLLPEEHGKIRVGTACQGTVLLFQEAYRKELKEKMGGNFYVFFPSAENCIWISGTVPFPEVQRCFQKIVEQTFSRESWVTDRIYLCDGKKLEFAGTLQDRQKVSSFKPKIR